MSVLVPAHAECAPVRSSARVGRVVAALTLAIGVLAAGRGLAGEPLSLGHALRLAQERSRTLAAQDSAALAAREMAVAAGQLPEPQLKLGLNNLPVNGADALSVTRDFMTMRSIGVMQEFTRQAKREARSARFEREADLAVAARAMALADLLRETATAWLECHFQQRMQELLIEQRDEARLQVDAADAAYRGGRAAQADVFAARSAAAALEDRLAQSRSELANARLLLERWTGEPAAPLSPPPADLRDAPMAMDGLQDALARHPEIAAMARREALARAEAEVARSEKLSDWSVEVMYNQRGPGYSNMVSVGVTLPLPWDQGQRQDRALAASLARVDQLRAEREEATRAHVVEIAMLLQEWRSDRARLGRFDDALIPLAADRARAAVGAYRGNAGTLAGVLDARRSELDVRLDRLRLELESARLWARLRFLNPGPADATAVGR